MVSRLQLKRACASGFMAEFGNSGPNATGKALLTRREIQCGWNWKSGSPADEINAEKFWAELKKLQAGTP